MSKPRTDAFPSVGRRRPANNLTLVVLPAPLGPNKL